MAIPYIWKQLIQRIRKHMNNGYPNDAYATTDNEILLYISQALSMVLVGNFWERAKIQGIMQVPEGYQMTVLLPSVVQDSVSGRWSTTLPQPPLSLELGYSITRVYPANAAYGEGRDFWPVKSHRVAFRTLLPKPNGGQYRVQGDTLWLEANDGTPLLNIPFYVQMPITRLTDVAADMDLPDDAIQGVFDTVTAELTRRYQNPKDIINDDVGQGKNNVTEPGA